MQESFQDWLDHVKEPQEKAELLALAEDPNAMQERFGGELRFGTGGLRGVIGMGTNCMNVYTVGRATRGLAAFMRASGMKKAAISYDSRKKSKEFAQTAACILAESGIFVVIVRELMPTPFLSFLTREERCDMGVMITASHNPSCYNGYKVYNAAGCQITDKTAKEVADFIEKACYFAEEQKTFAECLREGSIVYAADSAEERYLRGIRAAVGAADLRGLKVAYTALNGTGYRLVPDLLKGAGADVVLTVPQCEPDENFSTCPYPNPEKKEALALGLKTAEEHGCDLLIATDPDADRVGVAVRHKGAYVSLNGNQVGLLLVQYLLRAWKKRGDKAPRPVIVKTIVTTEQAEEIAADFGADVVNVLTGFKYIGEQIGILEQRGQADRFLLGMEESCGYLIGTQVRDKDAPTAAYAVCKMAKEYKDKGESLQNALERIYAKYGRLDTKLLSYTFNGPAGRRKIEALMRCFRESPAETLCGRPVQKRIDFLQNDTGLPRSDVLYFGFGNGESAVVRPSGTEPNLKVYLAFRAGMEQARQFFDGVIRQTE